ncbi:MAG: type IV pilus secretin PilQ [Burkholderiales bacterium]|nr:type IV pilus secretin PilQ [Burkholderiales bacterium]
MRKIFNLLIFYSLTKFGFANQIINVINHQESYGQIITFYFSEHSQKPTIMKVGNDLIMDIPNASSVKSYYDFENNYISRILLASDQNKLRVVIKNGALVTYNLDQSAKDIKLIFMQETKPHLIQKNKQQGFTTAVNNLSLIKDITFELDDLSGGVITTNYSSNNGQIKIKEQRVGERLFVKLNNVSFNESIIGRMDVRDFSSPVKFIDVKKGSVNQLNIELINRNIWDYAIYQLQNKLVINIRKKDIKPEGRIPNLNQTKSDKITLNFQDIGIRSLLQLLADFSGYNILVSDSVSGNISLRLNNVPWNQALQIILDSKNLGMSKDGNVIHIAPSSELASISKAKQENEKSQEAIEAVDSLTIHLKYAVASTVQSMLQQGTANLAKTINAQNLSNMSNNSASGLVSFASPNSTNKALNIKDKEDDNSSMLSERGSILIDVRTNMLIIHDTPTRLKEIKQLVDKIDVPVKQVLIEARIVQASNSFERDLGSRLLLAGLNNNIVVSNNLENALSIGGSGFTNSIYNNSGTGKFINSDMSTYTKGGISAIFKPNSNTIIGLEIDAMELQSEGRTISSPKVITANYQTASIQQGMQIPYQQVSSAGNTNIAFINATLALQVTPQITNDGNIMLNVSIQKNSPSTMYVQSVPAIDTNSVNTQVLVKDGSTILVGGIYIDEQAVSVQQIPGLGDIPYLGWLFKTQKIKNEKRELLIFITPRVLVNDLYDNK